MERLGGHPGRALGLDLETPDGRARWLCAARLASERAPEGRIEAAFRQLDRRIGAAPGELARAGAGRVAALLEEAGLARPGPAAVCLCRAGVSLAERHGGDLERLAAGCDGLEELGGRLAALAPGLGRATVLRSLRPLRDSWDAARETPLAETARAAAIHLGLLAEGADAEGLPSALRAALAVRAPAIAPADAEAALERLGARSCRAGRTARCPLGEACPARP